MAQVYQTIAQQGRSVSAYYARKRRRARGEVSAGRHGGLREQVATFGIKVRVTLSHATA